MYKENNDRHQTMLNLSLCIYLETIQLEHYINEELVDQVDKHFCYCFKQP
jgi:hypothetical protein